MNDESPFVRVVVTAFNGVDLTVGCLASLDATDWPRSRMDIVLVDNASSDDTVATVEQQFADVHVISSGRNLGFAGGCNLGIAAKSDSRGRPLERFDFVALVNNDAIVEPGWLSALVQVARQDEKVGAVAAKVLLAPRFSELSMSVTGDRNGEIASVRIRNVLVDGRPESHRTRFDERFLPQCAPGDQDSVVHLLAGEGSLWFAEGDDSEVVSKVEVCLDVAARSTVRLRSGGEEVIVSGDDEGRGWKTVTVELALGPATIDVINSAGGELYRDGSGGDRGFLERDRGQFDEPCEVFSWCGAGALLRREYIEDVGVFDPRLFLYYEDFDLSWRGRLAGWNHRYAPRAVIRHHHAQTTVEGSELFKFQTTRNRLLVLVKNAPTKMVVRAIVGETRRFFAAVSRIVMTRTGASRQRRRQEFAFNRRVMGSFLRNLPFALRERRRSVRRSPRAEVASWRTDKKNRSGFDQTMNGSGSSGSTP